MLKKLTKLGEYSSMFIIMGILSIFILTPSVNFNIIVDYPLAAPIGTWLQNKIHLFPILFKFINLLIMVAIALYLNRIGTSSEINPRQSYISASLLIIFMLFSPSVTYLTGTLVVMLLLVFSFGNMMNMFGKQLPFLNILNASMAISVSSMIMPHTIVFIIFIWFGFFTYSVNSWREWLISIIGLILPYIYMLFSFYWSDNLDYILNAYSGFVTDLTLVYQIPSTYQIITTGIILIIFLISMFHFINDASEKIISIRKKMWLSFQFSFVCLLVIASSGNYLFILFPLLYLPLTLMLSYSVHNQKKSRLYDILMVVLIISVMLNRLA